MNATDKAAAYDAYESELTNAWRNPPTGAGVTGMCGSQEGDPCTENGQPGTLRRGADGELFCDIGRRDAKKKVARFDPGGRSEG